MLCKLCRKEISMTTGTIFHRSHLPLRVWFRAIWWVTNQKSGVSALGLQRLLGLGSYRTAWTCLHKLRRAMVRPGRELLSGQVEVDETLIGGRRKGGSQRTAKEIVIIATEVRGAGMGRLRLQRIPDTTKETLGRFMAATIEPGSEIITDGYKSYRTLKDKGFRHWGVSEVGRGREAPGAILPRAHRVASLLKRWLLGAHQGRSSKKQLDHYLEEFAFRFNRRSSEHRGMLFFRLVQQSVVMPHTPYKDIRGASRVGRLP